MQRLLLNVWKKLSLSVKPQIQVMRMMNDKFLVGVTGVIFNADHEVLIVKHSYRRVPWSLPGGFLQAGEHPKEGLVREIFEETHFIVHADEIVKTQHDKETARLDICIVGTYKKGKFKKSHEVTDYGFFKLDKLPSLIDDQYEQIESAYKKYKKEHSKSLLHRVKTFLR
jgi:ADP-ribose pyrophosphatase YjhB (NUDIX family)